MKKVLIALESDFSNEVFKDNFFKEGFQVATTSDGEEALAIINTEIPDVVLVDINLPKKNGLEIINELKKAEKTKRIPVVIYSRTGAQEHREKAMDYEARDFVVGLSDSPHDVVLKVKAHLGKQKTYIFPLSPDHEPSREITRDMGMRKGVKCPSCNAEMFLHLIRDLSLGKNNFKLSFTCSKCGFRSSASSQTKQQ